MICVLSEVKKVVTDIIIGLVVILAILLLVYLGASMILRFDRASVENKRKIRDFSDTVDKTNKDLDATLRELQSLNSPMEKVNKIFKSINNYLK